MEKSIDKREIQARIEELRKKIANQGIASVLEKKEIVVHPQHETISLGEEGVFYILETRTLIIAIVVCLTIVLTAYCLNLKTDYLSIGASYFFRLFS